MKNLLLFISIFIITNTILSANNIPTRTDEFPKEQMKSQNKTIAKMFAQEISKSLPQNIDKYTKFVKIISKGSTIVYTFEINSGSKSDKTIREEDNSRMHKAVENGICKSSMKFLEAGINISYIYISAISKAHLFQFDVKLEDCIKVTN